MQIKIVNRHGKRNEEFEEFVGENLHTHILQHFHFDPERVKVTMTVDLDSKKLSEVHLHFHYNRKHLHYYAKDSNKFKAASHVIKSLSRKLNRNHKRSFKRKQPFDMNYQQLAMAKVS